MDCILNISYVSHKKWKQIIGCRTEEINATTCTSVNDYEHLTYLYQFRKSDFDRIYVLCVPVDVETVKTFIPQKTDSVFGESLETVVFCVQRSERHVVDQFSSSQWQNCFYVWVVFLSVIEVSIEQKNIRNDVILARTCRRYFLLKRTFIEFFTNLHNYIL